MVFDPFTIFAAASAIFGGASVVEGAKASRRSRRAQAAQRQLQNLRAAKERSQKIRETRMAYAAAENRAALGGVMESSGSQGGLGSIMTQGNTDLAYIDRSKALADLSSKWLDSAAKAESSANMFAGLSSLAQAGADFDWGKAFPSTPAGPKATGSGVSNSIGKGLQKIKWPGLMGQGFGP